MTYTDEYDFCRPYLTPGEAILWKGKPEKGRLLTSQDIYMIPFSLLWCGFAFFWEITAIMSGAPLIFTLFGLPFIGVGLYIVFGRFIWTSYIRKRTAYVITNKKILRKRGNKIDMMDGGTMPPMFVTANSDGSGTIRFGQETPYYRRNTLPISQNSMLFCLENVSDVARVQQVISDMKVY